MIWTVGWNRVYTVNGKKEKGIWDMQTEAKKYGVLRNVLFMLRVAKEHVPGVIWLAVLDGILAVAVSVTELYVAPSILHSLEMHGTLPELLHTILFSVACITTVSAVHAYVQNNLFYGRIEVRNHIITG